MSYIINYSSVFRTKIKAKSRFTGSSKFIVVNDELIERKTDNRKVPVHVTEITEEEKGLIEQSETINNSENECIVSIELEKSEVKKKTFKLNKTKLKRKCYALSRLEKSKAFLAFYSISFPQNLSDDAAYRVFNNWLTRCRKFASLNTYLWVAERQKNGTIHFHLLTNDRMEIRIVNGYMATALKTEKNNGNEVLKDYKTDTYNGVDVQKVKKNKKGLINYVAKYISKNDIEFYRLPWHCSRDVSRLFTSTTFEEDEKDFYLDQLPQGMENYTEKISDENLYIGYGFKFTAPDSIFENIDSVNETIYTSN